MPAPTNPSPPHMTLPARPQNKRKLTGKTSRSTTLSRKTASQSITKLGSAKRDSQHEATLHNVQDDETFLNFCANCEKQIKVGAQVLYCSEVCRSQDQTASSVPRPIDYSHPLAHSHVPFSSSSKLPSPPLSPFATSQHTFLEGPDIVAQASPTAGTFRSRGYFGSDGAVIVQPTPKYPYAASVPTRCEFIDRKQQNGSTAALASLRELSSALDFASRSKNKSSHSRSSVDSSSEENTELSEGSSFVRSGSAIWSYMVNSGRGSREQVTDQHATQPTELGLHARPNTPKDRSMSFQERRLELTTIRAINRPLPPRTASYRPRSIDLLIPLSGTG